MDNDALSLGSFVWRTFTEWEDSDYSHNFRLRQEWIEYLQRFRWDWFVTITFNTPRQPHHATSTILGISKVLRRLPYERRHFVGSELHLNRTLHVHGLLQVSDKARGAAWYGEMVWAELFERYGRTDVSQVRETEAVANYVTKYTLKGFTEYAFNL